MAYLSPEASYAFKLPIFELPIFSSPSVSYSNDVASVIVVCCKARFVTTRAISMKLGVMIPLGNTPRYFFDFRDLTYFVAYL
jgi:hypothetical protein